MGRWAAPDGAALCHVMSSAAAALGVRGLDDRLGLGASRQAVVVLVDGLGLVPLVSALELHGVRAPTLAAAVPAARPISAPFPSTTPAGLAALGTGLSVGCHGLVGASFVLPETGHVLWPLGWRDQPTPAAVQPEPTVFELAQADGVEVATISPRAFEHSGLTRAVLRGGRYVGADSFGERVGQTARSLASGGRSLVHVYWGDLDKTGHVHGTDSHEWRAELEVVDLLLTRLLDAAPPGTMVVVTADHGMVDTGVVDRFHLDSHPDLRHGVSHIAGEPRVRHVYARPGAAAEVLATWRGLLGERAEVMAREAAVAEGLFGEVDPGLVERIGDVVVVATGTTVLASESVDSLSSSLVGQHGALTEAEMSIPLLVWRA